jgi:RNA polymerase sigma-70 factor (ECF subfamily)
MRELFRVAPGTNRLMSKHPANHQPIRPTGEPDPDHVLVQRVQREGDHESFSVLVRRHAPFIRKLLLRMTRGDASLSEDLLQETFLRAYRGLPRFEGRSQFRTWLCRICQFCFLKHRDRSLRAPFVYKEPVSFDEFLHVQADPDLRLDLIESVCGLSAHFHRVIVHRHVDGLAYQAIADRLSIPIGTVKTHLHRARRELRQSLELAA